MDTWMIATITVTLCALVLVSAGYIMGVMAPHIDKREAQKAQERQIPITAQVQKNKPAQKQQPTLQQSSVPTTP